MFWQKVFTVAVAAIWVALALTPAAHADPDYGPYLNCLNNGGLVFKDPNDAVRMGRQIRQDFRTTPGDAIYRELEMQAGMSPQQARTAVACSLMYNLPKP